MSARAIEKVVQKERYFLMPGRQKKKNGNETASPELVKLVTKKLDINGDKEVSKSEFKMQWSQLVTRLFKSALSDSKGSKKSNDGCSIQ
jgi:hypothetical protein